MAEISEIVERLRLERHRSSTQAQYYCVWKLFNKFFIKLDIKPTSWEDRLTLFVGYLVHTGRKSTTIKSYISAVKAVLATGHIKLKEDRALLNSLTRACRLRYNRVSTKLPIKKPLLEQILHATDTIFDQQLYLKLMYKVLFITAYYGLFRIGELTYSKHTVKTADVQVGVNKNKLQFILHSSKTHCKGNKPQIIKISASTTSNRNYCPFSLVKQYLVERPHKCDSREQFFVFSDCSPVKPHHFRTTLKSAIKIIGLDHGLYGSHCFRAGQSVDLLKAGISVETIKKIGRWKSNAVYTYLS